MNEECMGFLRASKERSEQTKAAGRNSGKQQEEEFLDCEDGLQGVAEETDSQLHSGPSTLDSADSGTKDSGVTQLKEVALKDDITEEERAEEWLEELTPAHEDGPGGQAGAEGHALPGPRSVAGEAGPSGPAGPGGASGFPLPFPSKKPCWIM